MKVGLWVDHAKAVIVGITGKKEQIVTLESNVNRHFRSPSGKKDGNPNGRRNVTPDDIQERVFTEHSGIFFKKIILRLRGAESILIFGPGESKGGLVKKINNSGLSGRIAVTQTSGKMTDNQIAAKVRGYFHDKDRRERSRTVTGHAMPDFRSSKRKTDVA
ncbi:MAG: hypothetical protein JW803_00235 [Endomicrobiales bacterium]|nr:hypothetical protein [Endomicrobiales bacterium]